MHATTKVDIRTIENTWITLHDGCRLAARIWLPITAEQTPVPAILEYLPYRKRDGTAVRDEITHPTFAARGYACVRVDIRGNGDSEGLMEDEYSAQELADGTEVIDWIARQPWCSGAVGMIGISWGGFNALQIAALDPAPLKAIVTVCSTDDRYADDIHYMGGCLLNDNLGWSQQMLGYSSRPPDPQVVGERWREMWLEQLQRMPLLAANWLRHLHRDAYWAHGSVCEDYSAIRAAVLAVGGCADAYTNAVPRLLANLESPCRGIVGPWEHKYPNLAHNGPASDFLGEALRWWDRWLKNLDNGAMEVPAYRVFMADAMPPCEAYTTRQGRWIGEPFWPADGIEQRVLHLNAGELGPRAGATRTLEICSPQDTGVACGSFCPGMRVGAEMPGDQRVDDGRSLCFDSEPLAERLEILGGPELELEIASDRPVALVAARLCDVQPDGASARVTWRPLNLCHRDGPARPEPLVPGNWYRVRFALNDVAYAFPPGHRIRLALSTTYWPMLWPSPQPVTLRVRAGRSRLNLPVRAPRALDESVEFAPPPEGPTPAREQLRSPASERREINDAADGTRIIETFDDFGATRDPAHGLETGSHVRQTFRIRPHDPLSAEARAAWTHTLGRDAWQVRTETRGRMWSDATHFHLEARLEAYEGERLTSEKDWNEAIPRDGI